MKQEIPQDILDLGIQLYPVNMQHVSGHCGDVDYIDTNAQYRYHYMQGRLHERNKGQLDYVLVMDYALSAGPLYYCGYMKGDKPEITSEYVKAMKIPYPSEARTLCDELNKICEHSFHVEEHMYMK